jgi:hypothetical protein
MVAVGFDVPEVQLHEGDKPTVIGLFAYADKLTGKCRREIDLSTTWEVDESIVADSQYVVVGRVVRIGQESGVLLGRRHIDVGGALHFESFVWALGVELVDEIVEPLLLLEQVVSCGTSSFGFQRAAHSLVATIVLRMGWSAALKLDA